MDGAFSRAELEAAVRASGGNKAAIARGLRVAAPRINEWLSGKVENTKYTRAQLAHAVLIAQGKAEPAEADLSGGLLDQLEADARRMLERIRKAKGEALGAPTPSDSAHVDRLENESRAAQDAADQAPPAPPRKKRRKGGGHP